MTHTNHYITTSSRHNTRYVKSILQARGEIRILTAAPEANGFLGARGVLGLVPAVCVFSFVCYCARIGACRARVFFCFIAHTLGTRAVMQNVLGLFWFRSRWHICVGFACVFVVFNLSFDCALWWGCEL